MQVDSHAVTERETGARLRAMRESLCLTQQNVARMLHVDRSTIMRIEERGTGHNLTRYEELLRSRAERRDTQGDVTPVTSDLTNPADADTSHIYGHVLQLLLRHPDLTNNTSLTNEERTLVMMAEAANLTTAQRFRLLGAIFGLLAERLERMDVQK